MTFKLNGKEYKAKELDYNAVCDLQDLGVDISKLGSNIGLSEIRAIIAVVTFNGDTRKSGNLIGEHLVSGGTFEEVVDIVAKLVEESGFFQALSKLAEAV